MKKTVILIFLMGFSLAAAVSAQTTDTRWYTADSSATNFIISTADELAGLAELVNRGRNNFTGKTITLSNNIDLSAYTTGEGWTPIGRGGTTANNYRPFRGTFDGGNFVIDNLTINYHNINLLGLFGLIIGGRVENVRLENVNIEGSSSDNVGGVAGFIDSNSHVINSYSTGLINSKNGSGRHVGGVVGFVGFNSNVINCYSTGTVGNTISTYFINSYVGGVAGFVTDSSAIINSYSISMVIGNNYVGGIAGSVGRSIVNNCYFTGTVIGKGSGGSYIGGVVGGLGDGLITNAYSTGAVTGIGQVGGVVGGVSWNSSVNNTYSTSVVNGRRHVGGVAGGVFMNGIVTNSAALNPEVRSDSIVGLGRVIGYFDGNTLSNNIAYVGLTNKDGNTTWANIGEDNLDGANITIAEIKSDWTMGGRFVTENGWSIENGWLFELDGETVLLPSLQAITTSVTPQSRQRQIQSSSAFNMRVLSARNSITNISYTLNTESTLSISVYNLKGKKIASQPKRLRTVGEHTFSFKTPKGFYIVEAKVQNKSGESGRDAKHRVFTERVLVR